MTDELIDYDLPPERIAQEPAAERTASRLLVLDRGRGTIEHRRFMDILEHLSAGDLLVLNDTRVIPARLRARRAGGGAAEIFLLEPDEATPGAWFALVRPGKAGREGREIALAGTPGTTARFVGRDGPRFRVELRRGDATLSPDEVHALCEASGETPLPPYIHRSADAAESRAATDRERYQTVFARMPGAVAAPTAGLHFTEELLGGARAKGVEVAHVTLHVGADTFRPLTEDVLASGELHGERVEIGAAAGESILRARSEGRRVVAVGTTSVRALESFALSPKLPYRERTRLFIRPGWNFALVDALVTNFHLPRSSLLLLVAALAGRESILRAYRNAIEEGYRFYSYGDAMLIV